MVTLIITVVAAVVLGPLALRYGVDSRPGFDERPEPFGYPRRIL